MNDKTRNILFHIALINIAILAAAFFVVAFNSDIKEKEVPCYDNHNNQIKGLSCTSQTIDDKSDAILSIIILIATFTTVAIGFILLSH